MAFDTGKLLFLHHIHYFSIYNYNHQIAGLWGKIDKMIDWCEGVKFKEFEEEFKGEGWVMYGYDGIGIFVVDEGYDVDKCKDEYDVILNDGEICEVV